MSIGERNYRQEKKNYLSVPSQREAKATADKRIVKLEQRVRELERQEQTRDLVVGEQREALRRELSLAQEREIQTHEELQRALYSSIKEKEKVIANLSTQLASVGELGSHGAGGAWHCSRKWGCIHGDCCIHWDCWSCHGTGGGDPPGDGGGLTAVTGGGTSEGGRGMKLPALPTFDGEGKDEGAFTRWLTKLEKHAELLRWTEQQKLLQFELHLTGHAERLCKVLSSADKSTFQLVSEALGRWVRPAKRAAQMLGRKQRPGESVDN